MNKETNVAVKKMRVRLICVIVASVLAAAAFFICQFAVGAEKLGFQPFLMLFIVFFLFVGVSFLIIAAIRRRTLIMLSGGGSFIIGLVILMICLHKVIPWYVTLVVAVTLIFILFIMTFVTKAPDLHIEYDNGPGSGRKDYKERRAEKEEELKKEHEAEKEKPLPEIKSFKD